MDRDAVLKSYRRYAGGYDLCFGAVFQPGRCAIIDRMACRPGDSVLEVGIGTGLSLPLYPPHVRITGVDISPDMLARAQKRCERHGLSHVTLHCVDAEGMDLPDHSFDKVVAMYVVSVAPDPVRLVNEMRRVCKPGGELYIVNHFQHNHPLIAGFERLSAPLSRLVGFRPDFSLEKFLGETGLVIEENTPVNLFGYWSMLKARNV